MWIKVFIYLKKFYCYIYYKKFYFNIIASFLSIIECIFNSNKALGYLYK